MEKKLPRAVNRDVLTQESGKELLLYDLKTDKAYCLNETSARVYTACNGVTTFAELKAQTDFTDDLIFLTLDELKRENLLENDEDYRKDLPLISRREAAKRVGLASAAALPLITSIIAPRAANAQSAGSAVFNCAKDPVVPTAGGCLMNISYRLGYAADDTECQDFSNSLPPTCFAAAKITARDNATGCCVVSFYVNPYA